VIEISSPYIKLKGTMDNKDYDDISSLQRLCLEADKTALKLELDYKLSRAKGKQGTINGINEFMYYDNDVLVGYIGIDSFGGRVLEVNGMVHPQYRRREIFKRLYSLVKDEFAKRNVNSMLLLSDRNSIPGQEFIKAAGTQHEHSEYEMFLREEPQKTSFSKIVLRKADNNDAREIAYQNAIYFGVPYDENAEITLIPEEEEKCGMIIYMAEYEGNIIGKVHLEVSSDTGGIYGLGVKPEYRSRGYGREILMGAAQKLKERNSREIMLQVAAKNQNALNLYKSCGFVETSTMDYYEIKK
jgi:ribosomal protein S18 acetylase RimI-like enzyme